MDLKTSRVGVASLPSYAVVSTVASWEVSCGYSFHSASFYQKFQKTKVRLMGRSGCPYLPLMHFFPLFSAFFSFLGSVRKIQTVTFSACMLLKRQSSISAAVGWPFLPDAVNPPFLPVGWQSGITYPIREEAVINHIFIRFRLPPSSLEMSLSLTLKADLLWNQTHISPIPSWLAFERGE